MKKDMSGLKGKVHIFGFTLEVKDERNYKEIVSQVKKPILEQKLINNWDQRNHIYFHP